MMDLESLAYKLTKVEFVSWREQYSYHDDLLCQYRLVDYKSVEGDRIAIYKSGWAYVKDYFLFEWTPVSSDSVGFVTFNKHCLPQDDGEFYQFCYISAENEVLGASTPFEFVEAPLHTRRLSSFLDTNLTRSDSVKSSIEHDSEMLKLREENEMLKGAVKLFISQRNPRDYSRDVTELKGMVYSLKDAMGKQQVEIDLLKKQIHLCVQSNTKLLAEKEEVQKKLCDLTGSECTSTTFGEIDLSELESIPEFPFPK